jgi:glycosyltransferase involved in cell wall biosynthesis
MRVCLATWALPPGGNVTGTPAHVLKSLRVLNECGVEAWLLELDLARAHRPIRAAAMFRHAWRELRARRPDVIHAHHHAAALAVLAPAKAMRIPLVCELHGLYVASALGLPGGRPLLSRVAKALEMPSLWLADHVIAQAEAMRDRLLAAGIPRRKVTVIYPGLQTAEFSGYSGPPAEIPGVSSGDVVALYAGSTHAYQGLELLARAQRHLPPGFRIVLAVSRDQGVEEDVVGLFGFDPRHTVVMHLERSGDLPALFRRADVLVHARPDVPDSINVQSKLGLYLASGRPLAVTDVGDYRTLLQGCAGCVLAAPEERSVARAIADAATRPEVVATAGVENVRLAQQHFEAEANAMRLVSVYAALARNGPESRGCGARGEGGAAQRPSP